jgi:hypothetical protein
LGHFGELDLTIFMDLPFTHLIVMLLEGLFVVIGIVIGVFAGVVEGVP